MIRDTSMYTYTIIANQIFERLLNVGNVIQYRDNFLFTDYEFTINHIRIRMF